MAEKKAVKKKRGRTPTRIMACVKMKDPNDVEYYRDIEAGVDGATSVQEAKAGVRKFLAREENVQYLGKDVFIMRCVPPMKFKYEPRVIVDNDVNETPEEEEAF